jgi:AAA family ATP:ADP antiporter
MPSKSPVISAPALPLQSEPKRRLSDRFLSLFAEVRSGEGIGALLLAANVYLLLEAYYILKTVREALILSEGGAEIKTYSSAAQAALLLLIIPAYGVLASRVNRDRLITFVTIFFASHLAIFYVLGQAGVRVGVLFFLWVGIFNLFVIAQFWAFANVLPRGRPQTPVSSAGEIRRSLLQHRLANSWTPERAGKWLTRNGGASLWLKPLRSSSQANKD